jgi:NADPH2:quinone reductase
VTTVGNAAKAEFCAKLGAHTINYREQDFVAQVKRISGGHGADVILDMVGGQYAERNIDALAMDGRLVHLSSGADEKFTASLSAIMARRAVVTGSGLRSSDLSVKREIVRQVNARVWRHLGTKVTPTIDSIFPLAKANEAHARMETSRHIGKILLQAAGG